MMTTSLITPASKWSQSAVASFSELRTADTEERSELIYRPPELFFLGYAASLILAHSDCDSKQAARRVRRLIDECGGSLSFSPAKECQRLQLDLSLVSRQFKKLYCVTMRSYSRQIRMQTAKRLLNESNHLNIDEMARIFGYRFTSAFSRCFQRSFGKRPKRYQMERASSLQWQSMQESTIKTHSSIEA